MRMCLVGVPRRMDTVEISPFTFGASDSVLAARYATLAGSALTGTTGGSGDRTGLMIWPGCRAMCRVLASEEGAAIIRGAHVIELGAGPGACGAVAARNAAFVLVTDSAPESVTLSVSTLAANGVGADRGDAAIFAWGADSPAALVAKITSTPRRASQRVVVASECAYPSSSDESLLSLFTAIREIIEPAGVAFLSYVSRRPETTVRVCAAAWKCGLTWHCFAPQSAPAGTDEVGAVVLIMRVRGGFEIDASRSALEARLSDLAPEARGLTENAFPGLGLAAGAEELIRQENEEELKSYTVPSADLFTL